MADPIPQGILDYAGVDPKKKKKPPQDSAFPAPPPSIAKPDEEVEDLPDPPPSIARDPVEHTPSQSGYVRTGRPDTTDIFGQDDEEGPPPIQPGYALNPDGSVSKMPDANAAASTAPALPKTAQDAQAWSAALDTPQTDLVKRGDGAGAPAPQSQPQAPQTSRPAAGGGGALSGDLRNITNDFNEQIDAVYRQKLGHQTLAGVEEAEGAKLSDLQRKQGEARYNAEQDARAERESRLDDMYKMMHAYADFKVDPDKFWNDKSVPQKIASVVGLGLFTFGSALLGQPVDAGLKIIQHQIDRSIALQQDNRDSLRHSAGMAQNLWQMYREGSKDDLEAMDKLYATYWDAAMSDAIRATRGVKGNIQAGQDDELIAAMKLRRDMYLAKAHSAGSGGVGVAGAGGFIPIEQGAHVVQFRGQQYLVGAGGEKLSGAIGESERAASYAGELVKLMGNIPNPYTDWDGYQAWYAQAREAIKNTAVAEASHLSQGSRSSLGMLQNFGNALTGPVNDPKGPVAAATSAYVQLQTGLATQIMSAAQAAQRGVMADTEASLRAHGATPGSVGRVQVHGTGEFKGVPITKEVFVPGQGGQQQPAAPQAKPDRFGNFTPGQ